MKGYKIASGRDFSSSDLERAANVCIVGVEVISQLFEKNINPLIKKLRFLVENLKLLVY
jgi:putative ABC transport system permease protein